MIYILNSCNEWKEYSSMEKIIVTTSIRKLRRTVKYEVEHTNIGIGNEKIYHDWLKGNYYGGTMYDMLNNIMDYGYLEVWED